VRLSAPLSAPAKLPGRPGFDFRNKGDIQNPDAIAAVVLNGQEASVILAWSSDNKKAALTGGWNEKL